MGAGPNLPSQFRIMLAPLSFFLLKELVEDEIEGPSQKQMIFVGGKDSMGETTWER
jgi:hypothetical protein